MTGDESLDLEADNTPSTADDGPVPARTRKRGRGRGPKGRAGRKGVTPPDLPLESARMPWVMSSRVLLALAGLTMAAIWLGGFNREFGAFLPVYPWELFRENGADGGAWVFSWGPFRSAAIAMGALTLGLFALQAIWSPRARGAVALVIIVCGLVSLPPEGPGHIATALVLLMALLAGALLARGFGGERGGSRALIFIALLMLAAHALLPQPNLLDEYRSPAATFWMELTDTLPHPLDTPHAMSPIWERPDTPILLAATALAILGMAALVGVRGRWMGWTAGGLLVAALVASAVLVYHLESFNAVPGNIQGDGRIRVVTHLRLTMAPFALALAAAVPDLLRPRKS